MIPATQIEADAARWLARRDAGGFGPADEEAFGRWIGTSTAHRVAYLRLRTAWTKAERLRALGPDDLSIDDPSDDVVPDAAPPESQTVRLRWWGGGLATALAASAAWLLTGTGAEYATPVGGFERLPLADGSRVELNTDTEIEVVYSDDQRRIELERGEAYFDVAKDMSRPFVVEAGAYRVVAVGTAFSVRLTGEEIDVLVTEGRVRIERESVRREIAEPIYVSAGHKAGVEAGAPVVSAVPRSGYRRQLGWREGVLIFDNRPLREVVAEFNRHNRRQLVVPDPQVGAVTIGGTFRPTNLAGLTRLLEPGFGIEAVADGEDRIILRFAE